MLSKLSLQEFLELAKNAKRVVVFQEIPINHLTSIGIVQNLKDEMRDGCLLETGLHVPNENHFSFIALDLIAQIRSLNKTVLQHLGTEITSLNSHPFDVLRQTISQLSVASLIDFPGIMGFISYDAVRYFEAIPDNQINNHQLPDMLFNFYRTILVFDHLQEKIIISTLAEIGQDPKLAYDAAAEKISHLIAKILSPINSPNPEKTQKTELEVDISDEKFIELVKQAKEYIEKGDAFQIVLSRCFQRKYSAHPLEIYRTLCRISPAPYMFYFPIDDFVLLGASPEKFISVLNQEVAINPIAGTRRRTAHIADADITQELLQDTKELSEHMMLVDLARNDLGRVCEIGTIKIKELLQVKHFSHVSHITSIVTGQLQKNKDAFDAVAATFPAGTLSGAPKIRAMEIIDELETSKRGIYGGAICRLDYQGNLDSCITIRTALLKDGIATVRTGAGIVYDSNPLSEANETRQKAQAILDALTLAEEGFE